MEFLDSIDFLAFKPINNLELLLRIVFAILVGTVIGIEREYKSRPAGLRTHVLVCLGSCSIALLESVLIQASFSAAASGVDIGYTFTRMSAQVISGIGFLGAGTIFTAQKKVAGLTTAASLWNVACLGLMIGFGYYWMGLIVALLVILVLMLMGRMIHINAIKHVEVKFVNRAETIKFINEYFAAIGVLILDIDFHIEVFKSEDTRNLYTNIYTLHLPGNINYTDIVTALSENPYVHTVRTRSA
ncbi:MAG: MgtC/SapB family protein [Clostridiales bacterium]|nr:MgtC/SapB family protein [Clostridiales bacterium]